MNNNYNDVLNYIALSMPNIIPNDDKWYTIKYRYTYKLRIRKPSSFDNYVDVVARVTLFCNDMVLMDCLITVDTDLNKLCEKIKKKIITNEINGKD